ncbi:LppP/LprE family lipoprotein [Mycolicibacterium vanbaalenii]|jgi:hypothetical protein|uniref:LppP n=1 Tax=Mycolicibacterium vanbaalenii (strain DSM 7251 / JCM 13017 / BCRC 16820 / KCTC 9966 / NRRL B-24157 / PYR-1) TaxID=350058 RepID=A1TBP0_MYCVP|nr:LppP/LprE family lipoprotein [Mycolicibacterium vanbaalenii]ABM14590.1 LppP [Mycolicibacterium vanbaalenii PYR-1]MCV7130529.1 LppP/LprE family lipoprotein [Mycolicibacterium vanbaalenii PYR-1]
MSIPRLVVALVTVAALSGCGWSPPAPPPTSTAAECGPGPAADVVAAEIAMLPPAEWEETERGHSADCRLNWVVVSSGHFDAPQQVLFFDGTEPVGSPTPEPRRFITVIPQGRSDAVVQYQWRQGQDEPCCPTGIGTARVTLEEGRLTILDPIPGP